MAKLCMTDNRGRSVPAPLPHMQSAEGLRAMIRAGDRTAECWAELKRRRERVRAAMAAIHGPKD